MAAQYMDLVAAQFFEELGGLHDSLVTKFSWEPTECKLVIDIDDIFSNFVGLPEYPGKMAGQIEFKGIKKIILAADVGNSLWITDVSISSNTEGELEVTLLFSPGGQIYLICSNVIVPDISDFVSN